MTLLDRFVMTTADRSESEADCTDLLISRLGQRLAFEQACARLYDALLHKCRDGEEDTAISIISLPTVRLFRDEAREAVRLLEAEISELGADSGDLKPAGDASTLAALDLPGTIADARISIKASIEAIQLAEFKNSAGWRTVEESGPDASWESIPARFRKCVARQKTRKETLTNWLALLMLRQAKMQAKR